MKLLSYITYEQYGFRLIILIILEMKSNDLFETI